MRRTTLEDDDDIEWKPDPFKIRPDSANLDSPDELLGMIRFEGSPEFQEKRKTLGREYIDVFLTSVWRRPANVDPMEITVDRQKWKHPSHSPPSRHSSEKQAVIRSQTEALLKLGVSRRPGAPRAQTQPQWMEIGFGHEVHLAPLGGIRLLYDTKLQLCLSLRANYSLFMPAPEDWRAGLFRTSSRCWNVLEHWSRKCSVLSTSRRVTIRPHALISDRLV